MKNSSSKNICKFFYMTLEIVIFLILFLMPIKVVANDSYAFSYTGKYQEFIVPNNTRYRIQLWGAQGGDYDSSFRGGFGGYTEGEINLLKGTKLYIYVGGQPSSDKNNLYGGWNGGGATDIRTVPTTAKTTWNSKESLASRIMVASGGGLTAYI